MGRQECGDHQKNAQGDRERFTATDLHDHLAYGIRRDSGADPPVAAAGPEQSDDRHMGEVRVGRVTPAVR